MPLRPPHRAGLLLALPLALALAAYARVLPGEFVYDDEHAVVRNPDTRDLATAARAAWAAFRTGGRPVADLTFAANRALGGLDPRGYHAVNLGLHLLAVVLLYLLARRLLGLAGAARARWQALAVAGLWALHPLGSQAVSYVTQRAEVLASALMVAALLAFLGAERRGATGRGAALLGLGLAALALALGSKAMAVTVPALWALVAWAAPGPEARGALPPWRLRALALLAPLALATAHAAGTLTGLHPAGNAGFDLPGLDPWTYLLSQVRAVVTYLRLVLWPAGQSVDWVFEPSRSPLEPAVLARGALLLALTAAAVALVAWGRRRSGEDAAAARLAGLGWLWFLVVLAPTSSVVPVRDLLVEHRAYLASFGPLLALVAGGERLLSRVRWRWAGAAGAVAVLAAWLALAAALHARNAVWESALALWSDATGRGRGGARAYLGLGVALAGRGDPQGALAAFWVALERARGRPDDEAHALLNAGLILSQAGRLDAAERTLRGAGERAPRGPEMAYALGWVRWKTGDLPGAVDAAERALAIQPDHARAAHLLGTLWLQAGRLEEAAAQLRQAARLAPGDPAVEADLAAALDGLGRAGQGR